MVLLPPAVNRVVPVNIVTAFPFDLQLTGLDIGAVNFFGGVSRGGKRSDTERSERKRQGREKFHG